MKVAACVRGGEARGECEIFETRFYGWQDIFFLGGGGLT